MAESARHEEQGQHREWTAPLNKRERVVIGVSIVVAAAAVLGASFFAGRLEAWIENRQAELVILEERAYTISNQLAREEGYREAQSGSPEPAGSGDPPAYSPELYDDCRDAFGSISPAGLRRAWAASGDAAQLGELTDDDMRGIAKVGCLLFATGADAPWGDLVP